MAKNKTNLTEKQIEEEAYKVIRGDYGNGDARKQKLGENYDAVQSKVNQLSKQAGGVSNVKAPSTTVSKPKSTQTNVKTSPTTQKNTTSSVKNESRVRTSSTANPINAPKTTKEEREKARQSYDKTSYKKKTETVNAGVPFISSEYKSNEVANANGSTAGTVKSLTKSNNLIEVEQADGSSKRVATKTVNTPSEREKDIEKYNSMTVGEKGYKTGSIRKSKESKAFAEELKQKYGIDDKELDEWNRQYTADKIKSKEERAVEVAKERSKKNAVLGEVAGATVKALDSAEGLGNVIAGKLGKDNQVNFHLQNMAEAYRSGADEKVGTGAKRKALDVGRMVTDLGSKAAVSMATGIPMAVLSAGSSADQSMREAMDRGADVNSAANYGALAGGIDYLLQKKGLDTIFNVKGANLVSSALKKGGVEALEEGAQTVLTRLVDSLTTGEKSRFNIIKQEALANGDSDNEATLKALADLGEETLLSSAGGFAFGGALDLAGAGAKRVLPSLAESFRSANYTPKKNTNGDVKVDNQGRITEPNVEQLGTEVSENRIPSEQVSSPRNVAEPQKFTEQNVNSQQNIPGDIPVVGGSGDTRYSDVYTNTLHDNDLANLADRIDRRDAEYNVHHNSETMANATNRVNTDAEKWTQDYLSGNVKATDDTDVDTLMLLIHQKKSEMNGATTPEAQAKAQAEFYGLKRKLRQIGTKAGQNVQAFKKWNGTPEGAVLNAERMYDADAQKWAKRNPNESKAVDTVAKSLVEGEKAPTMSAQNSSKVSNRLSKALSDLGNDSLKASNRVVKAPKTHEQIVSEVINTLDREFGSSRNHFNDTDIEILATFIEQGVPTRTLTDELQHKLQHGDWYTIDESIPIRKDVDPRVISALNKTIEQGETRPPKEQPSLSQLRDRVRNSLDTEYGSLSEKFTDEDVNFIANMINNGASTEDLADALKYKLANNMWEIPEETVNRVNDLFNEAQLYNEGSRQRVDLETQAFWQLANASGTKSSIADKFNSWRYLAMLGNPKTHVRNVVGNTLFQGVTGMSNTIAAAMESGVDSVAKRINNGQGIERTKAVLTPSDSSLIKACRTDAEDFSYRRLSGNKYNDNLQSDIRKQKEVFDSRIMRFLNGKNSDFLDKEDYSAMRNKYKTSLAGFLKANGLDESVFDAQHELDSLLDAQKYRMLSTSERARIDNLRNQIDVLNRGRDYAIAQAEYSAFHEDNRVAEILSDMSSKLNNSDSRTARGVGMLFEGALPFKKTPANILKSGLEYSPLNIINNAVKLVGLKKGKGSASDVIESISKTLTGTGLTILGASLYDKGILLSADEDTRWQDDLEGKQNYSLKIGGKTYTIDFAAPSVMPLLLGAEVRKVYDARRNETGEVEDGSFWDKLTSMLEDTTNSLTQLASPIMETSMLSGLNDTLNELSYSDNKLGTLASNTATSYLTQGVPTLLGQIARTVDPVRRDTYTDKTGVAGTVDKKVTKIKNKIPFLSESNEEYVDAYGRPQNNSPYGNMFVNGLYQMFSPSYIANVNETPVDTELRRLYDSGVTDSKIFSDSERKSAPKDSSNQRLSKEDFKEYSTKRGTIDYDVMEQLISSDTYKNLSDEDKASLIQKVHSMAKAFAHNEVDGKSMDSKTAALYDIYKESGIDGIINSFSDTIGYDTFIKDNGLALESNGSGKTTQENVATFIKSQNLSDEESGKLLFEKWKGGNVDDLGKKDAEFFKGDTPDYAGFWNAHKDKAVEITGQNVNSSQIPVENTTSDVKTIPSPKSLGNTASSNMIRQNAEQVKAQEEAIANFDIDQYTSGTSNGGTRFDEKKGLPALKEVYKTDAERSQAIIDSGVSTKGVDRTREIFGDDYVYQYYEIKAGADSNGDSKVTKKELIPFLQSQGMSEEEINKWWNVYKK